MSAFAALRNTKSSSDLFNNKSLSAQDDSDDGIIPYEENSDDSDGSIYQIHQEIEEENIEINIRYTSTCSNPIYTSRFEPTSINMVCLDDKWIIGLQEDEYVVLSGQFKFTVKQGAILLNDHHHIQASSKDEEFSMISPQSQGLPIISSAKYKGFPKMGANNFHSVIQIESLRTGLEGIGRQYPNFRNLFECKISSGFSEHELELRARFKDETFEIIFKDIGIAALSIDSGWSGTVKNLADNVRKRMSPESTTPDNLNSFKSSQSTSPSSPKIIIIIGNKNTGKSTFSKLLLNSFILKNQKVSYLDIDPGQSEFSTPGCLSLTTSPRLSLGLNVPSSSANDSINQFFGFNSPSQQPSEYISIINNLFNHFINNVPGGSLIINTPGWIKGFGKEMLIEFTQLVSPDHLILLSNSLDRDDPENIDTLNQLTYQNLNICQAVEYQSKFTASQLRSLNKLYYFHQRDILKFDFESHLLLLSPLKLSYATIDSSAAFIGVNAVTCLNFDVGTNFNHEDLLIMLDASLFGIYLVDVVEFKKFSSLLHSSRSHSDLPIYLDFRDFRKLNSNPDKMKFMGLCMVHSINHHLKYFNVYLPEDNALSIRNYVVSGRYKMLLVKGDGEIASFEFLHPALLMEHERQVKGVVLRRGGGESNEDWRIRKMPYVSFEGKKKVGGVWKVRRGVTRRGRR